MPQPTSSPCCWPSRGRQRSLVCEYNDAATMRSVLLPITTPFTADQLDHSALRSNIERWSTTGVGGFVVLGSTGERVHLDEREYLEVIETTRAAVPRGSEGLAFIVGAGQQST